MLKRSEMISGNVTSRGRSKGHKTHGESKTRLYGIWVHMMQRCKDANHPRYADYGGRGIDVCVEWLNYESFSKWAHANGYAENLSIDRINNNLGYSPENCRWATARMQANNTRRTRFVTYNNETLSVSEWARKMNINQSTLSMRINKYGWSVEDALGKEVRKNVS
jgi:hypothetical protein